LNEAQRRRSRDAERSELHGRDLCQHGAGGADPDTGRSHRCAFCRHEHNAGQHESERSTS
jgi:hypothetical protein